MNGTQNFSNRVALLYRNWPIEHGLHIGRHQESGVLYFHLHQEDEQGECQSGMWAVEHGNIAATMLAGLRALITGELPEPGKTESSKQRAENH